MRRTSSMEDCKRSVRSGGNERNIETYLRAQCETPGTHNSARRYLYAWRDKDALIREGERRRGRPAGRPVIRLLVNPGQSTPSHIAHQSPLGPLHGVVLAMRRNQERAWRE